MYLMTSLLVYIFIILISNAAFPSFRDMLTKIINEAEDLIPAPMCHLMVMKWNKILHFKQLIYFYI